MSHSHLPIPYLSKLEGGGITPGQSVTIRGTVHTRPEGVDKDDYEGRFDVNLSAGPKVNDGDEIPLHLSFRFKDGKVVLNTFAHGQWGKEERKKLPFKEGEAFDLRIRAHDNKFEVFINSKELCEYDYRSPLVSISHLFINGTIDLGGVNWGGKYYAVPYQAGIDNGLTPGKKLYITGMPDEKPKRLCINLLASNGDIALHLNPRFDEKHVVRNACKGGEWGNEEREGKFPLHKERVFDIVIQNEPYAFQVFINNEQFCTFAHRMDPNDINGLQIEGDVELQGVHVK